MNDRDVENLLLCYEGPQPRPETTRAITDAARKALPAKAKAPTPARPKRLLRFALPAAAACLCLAVVIRLLLFPEAPDSAERAGTVAVQLGAVASPSINVQRNGKTITLAREAALFAGDELAPVRRADIALADGSTVRLDKGTRLKLHKTPEGERARLGLESGRIFLRVAEAPGDFIVLAGIEVRVIGTSFGVDRNNRATSVDVIAGRVAVGSGDEQIELTRGESAAAPEGGPPAKTTADPNPAVAWARDAQRFEGRPLGEVLDWISSNSTYRFDAPPQITEIRVNVTVADQPMRELIESLALACDLRHSVTDHDVTLRK